MIAGRVTLAKTLDVREATSLQGSKITFTFEDGRILVGKASMLKSEIAASSGVIHVIDQVLIQGTGPSKPLSPSELIKLAIDLGVPVFNDGNVAECAAIYEITVEALRGQDAVPEKSRAVLANAIMAARSETSARKRAWILREAIDQTCKSLNESTR